MKPSANILFAACLVMIGAAVGIDATAAAQDAVSVQDFPKVKASDQVKAASWTSLPDSYVLQVVLDPARYAGKRRVIAAASEQKASAVEQKVFAPDPASGAESSAGNFLGATIADLRGLDPWFYCGRTLTRIQGLRIGDGQPVPQPDPSLAYVNQPYPPKFKEGRVDAWLLKADGTQILPTAYSCTMKLTVRNEPVGISYMFSSADGEHAIAAAVRIDDDYYIEKLQPLASKPAAQ